VVLNVPLFLSLQTPAGWTPAGDRAGADTSTRACVRVCVPYIHAVVSWQSDVMFVVMAAAVTRHSAMVARLLWWERPRPRCSGAPTALASVLKTSQAC